MGAAADLILINILSPKDPLHFMNERFTRFCRRSQRSSVMWEMRLGETCTLQATGAHTLAELDAHKMQTLQHRHIFCIKTHRLEICAATHASHSLQLIH